MQEIVEQWLAFMSRKKMGKKLDSMSHFGYMFNENLSDEELKAIFQFFPKKEKLLQSIKNVRAEFSLDIYLVPNKQGKEKKILQLAKSHLLEMQRIVRLGNEPEYFNLIDNSTFRITTQKEIDDIRGDYDGVDSIFRGDVDDVLTQYIPENIEGIGEKIFTLSEAFYGLTTDFNIKWYLFAPLLKLDIDYEAYVEFWKLGGDFAITENEVLISIATPLALS